MPDSLETRWQRNDFGLYVPVPHGGRESLSLYERTDLRHSRQQALAGVAGAVLALLALLGSGIALVYTAQAWDGQQTLTSQQITLNQVIQNRERRIYSSRVALWANVATDFSSVRPAGIDVFIQNRSPVPLRRVRLLVPLESGEPAEARLKDIPPCTTRALRVSPPIGQRFAGTNEQWLGYSPVALVFQETAGVWRLDDSGLVEMASVPALTAAQLQYTDPMERSVTDCGEGA